MSERAEDVRDQPPACRGGVNLLGQCVQTGATAFKLTDGGDEVRHRPAQSVELLDHQRVAASHIGKRLRESRRIGFGA